MLEPGNEHPFSPFIANFLNISESQLDKMIQKTPSGMQLKINADKSEEIIEDVSWKLDELILNSPKLDKDIIVYRGVQHTSYMPKDVGSLFKLSGITSTSVDINKANDFGDHMFVIRIPKGTSVLMIREGFMKHELEVVLPHNAIFMVDKIEKTSFNSIDVNSNKVSGCKSKELVYYYVQMINSQVENTLTDLYGIKNRGKYEECLDQISNTLGISKDTCFKTLQKPASVKYLESLV
jgi:hypothetical protein